MKIFTDEFTNFLKRGLICSWNGHRKGKWVDVYWAPGHSSGYQSRFCEICRKEMETNKKPPYGMFSGVDISKQELDAGKLKSILR